MSWRSHPDPHVDPDWSRESAMPCCSTRCTSFDGKRCMKLGGAPVTGVCLPMVHHMSDLLDKAEAPANLVDFTRGRTDG